MDWSFAGTPAYHNLECSGVSVQELQCILARYEAVVRDNSIIIDIWKEATHLRGISHGCGYHPSRRVKHLCADAGAGDQDHDRR